MTDVNIKEIIEQSYINSMGNATLNNDHQARQKILNKVSEEDHLKKEWDKIEKRTADLRRRESQIAKEKSQIAKEKSQIAKEKSQIAKEKSQIAKEKSEMVKEKSQIAKEKSEMAKEKSEMGRIESQMKKENDRKTQELREQEELLKQKHDSMDEQIKSDNKLKKALNIETHVKQNLASKSDIAKMFDKCESNFAESVLFIADEIIKAINPPQKKKHTKEKSNDNQIDFLSDKQNISLPEDYVFVLQNGEELGQCENLQSFISGIGRAKITGNIDDFLADFNFYFNDEGEPFLEVNIAELHENTQKDLLKVF